MEAERNITMEKQKLSKLEEWVLEKAKAGNSQVEILAILNTVRQTEFKPIGKSRMSQIFQKLKGLGLLKP